ncbi:MAG: diguanylate cyclase [Bdellovibrionales bacterium]|nr:diguanylate cyclase [Bdellovibrionales bacterium]
MSKKPKTPWDQVRHTSTRTELQAVGDTSAKELLLEAQKRDPAFIVIQGEMTGKVFRLKPGRNVIGRHPNSDIAIQQRAVSGVHAEVRVADATVILEDLQSTNGTILNKDKLARPAVLQANDLIKIGGCVFKYIDSKLDASFAESLHQSVITDPLTGVYNKGYLLKAMVSALEIAKGGFPLSLIMFDLDHFKKVNDTYGHLAGDYVLKETCKVLKESVIRTEDILARYGGEEFTVVMPDSPLAPAVRVAERIRATLEGHRFEFNGTVIPVTASLGVVVWVPAFDTAEKMIQAADDLLYKSKQSGRNRVSTPVPA